MPSPSSLIAVALGVMALTSGLRAKRSTECRNS